MPINWNSIDVNDPNIDVGKLIRAEARKQKQVKLNLSIETAEFFRWTGEAVNVRWAKQFRSADSYQDLRPIEVKEQHRIIEKIGYGSTENRVRHTTTLLTPIQIFHLGELYLILDIYNEPNMTYKGKLSIPHMASRLLEAIAAGYIARTWIEGETYNG